MLFKTVLPIVKKIYEKLGGSPSDVENDKTVEPVLNKMLDYVVPGGGSSVETGRKPIDLSPTKDFDDIEVGAYDVVGQGRIIKYDDGTQVGTTTTIPVGCVLIKRVSRLIFIGIDGVYVINTEGSDPWQYYKLQNRTDVEALIGDATTPIYTALANKKENETPFSFSSGATIYATNNQIMRGSDIAELNIHCPSNFSGRCEIVFTTASDNFVGVYLQGFMFPNGEEPTIGAGETWELNVFDNRITYQKFEAVSA